MKQTMRRQFSDWRNEIVPKLRAAYVTLKSISATLKRAILKAMRAAWREERGRLVSQRRDDHVRTTRLRSRRKFTLPVRILLNKSIIYACASSFWKKGFRIGRYRSQMKTYIGHVIQVDWQK